jgi:hypothetical protein
MIPLRSLVIALLAAGAAGSADSTFVTETLSGSGDAAHEHCSENPLWTATHSPEQAVIYIDALG